MERVQTRETHWLERADARTDQSMETKQGSKGNSRSREGRCQDWPENRNKARQQVRGTHKLERTHVRTDQVMETKQSSKGNSRPGEGQLFRMWK